ncbi:MAG: hypothetical protein QM732_08000 [Roseateles sp.]
MSARQRETSCSRSEISRSHAMRDIDDSAICLGNPGLRDAAYGATRQGTFHMPNALNKRGFERTLRLNLLGTVDWLPNGYGDGDRSSGIWHQAIRRDMAAAISPHQFLR